MAKKSKIFAIAQKADAIAFETGAVFFRVGCLPLNKAGETCVNIEGEPAFPPVADIKHCRHSFGQGAAVDQACYAVTFEDSPETVVIPVTCVGQVNIMNIDEANIPALPAE